MESVFRGLKSDASLYASFGLITTDEQVSTYMFAAECNSEQTVREYTLDLLAVASNQQNPELMQVSNLLAVQMTDYKQFVKLRDTAEKVAGNQRGDPTVICHIRLHNHATKQVSTLSLIWHPVALNAI